MKKSFLNIIIVFIGCFAFFDVASQEKGFFISSDKDKLTIPFTSINNLIFVDVQVNGIPMVFLLDSGVDKTILFSLESIEEVEFTHAEKIKFRGLGYNPESVIGFKSSENTISLSQNFIDYNHDIYIIIDEEFNISSGLGIPVNGILGFEFFRNHVVEIDYTRNKIHIYNDISRIRKRIDKKYEKLNLLIKNNKPYLTADVIVNDQKASLQLLVDIGNGDAVWLFQSKISESLIPDNNFNDFLGRGFNGAVNGKRAKLDKIVLDKYTFEQPYIAFPDTLSVKNKTVQNGSGSIGAEILRRFTVVFDYKEQSLYLKPNFYYKESFQFNMSGIEIHHAGLEWMRVDVMGFTSDQNRNLMTDPLKAVSYKFELKPVFKIYSIRENSPAEKAGLLKDDEIISINGKKAYKFSLQEINKLLKSKEGKQIRFEVKRNDKVLKYVFNLKSIL